MRTFIILLASLLLALTQFRADAQVAGSYTLQVGALVLDMGERGEVNLILADATQPLIAWTAQITYDPEIVSVDGCIPGDEATCSFDTPGSIELAGESAAGLNAGASLATIALVCDRGGDSPLHVAAEARSAIPEDEFEVSTPDGSVDCAGTRSVPGDVNCDIYVSSVDASLVLKYHAALVDTLDCLRSADPNKDGAVNSVDAALILQFEAELICHPFADACIRD